MGRFEPKPIDTHTARILNGAVRTLQAKNFTFEENGNFNLGNSTVVSTGANISFTGGNTSTQNLTVSNSANFNGPVTTTSDVTIASTSLFNVNSTANFNNATQSLVTSGQSTFNGVSVFNNTINSNSVLNVNGAVSLTNNTMNMNNVSINQTNTNTTLSGTNTIGGTPLTFNNSVGFGQTINITGGINSNGSIIANNLSIGADITGAGKINISGAATFGNGISVIGPIISNGITVGDPTNTGTFAGVVIQNITGTNSSELMIKRPYGVDTNSLVYTTALVGVTGTGLSIYDRSGNKTFFLDNETGEMIYSPSTLIISNSSYTDTNLLTGGIIVGRDNLLLGVSQPYSNFNVIGNSNIQINDNKNCIGHSNNIHNIVNCVGNNNAGTLYNCIGDFNFGNNFLNSSVLGDNNFLTGAFNSDRCLILGNNNNIVNITGSFEGLQIIGSGFTYSDIIGNGDPGIGITISKNITLLGDKTSGVSCKFIVAGGLRPLVANEGEPVPPVTPFYYFSRIANVKIVTSKSSADGVISPENGNALYQMIQDSSSRRYKRNIHHTNSGFVDGFMKLKPSSYSRAGNFEYGLIAEEVAEIPEYKPFVGVDAEGRIDSIEYDRMVVLCIAKIQEQQRTIDTLNKRLEKIERLFGN